MEREERVGNILRRWRFVCGCPVCSLAGEELAENDRIRRGVAEHSQELERSSGEDLESDLANARSRLGLLRRLEEEAILATPDCLLHCYQLALAVEEVVHGGEKLSWRGCR